MLKDDYDKILDLKFSSIKQLVTYYQITNIPDKKKSEEFVNFNITFDKDKIHELFYTRGILYSEIQDKELFTLPIFIKNNEIFVFNNNFFYDNWNNIYEDDLIEFILPLENIEIIQNLNKNADNLINLKIDSLLKEYSNKNLALIIIEETKKNDQRIYLKIKIQEKKFLKVLI